MTLVWILAATVAGGVLSVIAAATLALRAHISWVPILISYAVGALLGAVFLDVLPQAFERADSPEAMALTILFGILIFFVLEKLGAVLGVSNLHIYAAMRGQSLEDFQKTRNQQVLYSVAGKSAS